MTVTIFVLAWVLLGLGLLFVAFSGGRAGAAHQVMSTSRGARRFAAVLFLLALLLLGFGIPAAVIAAVSNNDSIPQANVSDLTASEQHGRELFGLRCGWLRARLIYGDYGTPAQYVVRQGAAGAPPEGMSISS